MLRLTVRRQTPAEAALLVDGWVGGEDVGLLAREGTWLLAASRRLVLELAGLMAIDPEQPEPWEHPDVCRSLRPERRTDRDGRVMVAERGAGALVPSSPEGRLAQSAHDR